MGFTLGDRVQETTTTTGTGTISLAGAAVGFQSFVAAIGNGNTCYYVIADQSGGNWECGIGTVASGTPNTLARTAPINGSAGLATLVNFGAGTKNVFCSPLVTMALKPANVLLKITGTSYTPTAGTVALFVECVGGGGGGGGTVTAATSAAAGGGGGGGGYSAKFLAGPLKASYAYAIGAGGSAGSSAGGTGGNGGDTTFDSPSVCTGVGSIGGTGGAAAGTTQLFVSGGGGTGTPVGDITLDIDPGGWSLRLSGTVAAAGYGGAAPMGGGRSNPRITAGAGSAGGEWGGGGGGGLVLNGSAAVAGGAGQQGAIRITEYIA